ncbi:MAG: hypothetical protein K2Z81_21435 [Cyanobacteria bacterium]|nr:hypothetical protein [Cyanobacteriota bacterium]
MPKLIDDAPSCYAIRSTIEASLKECSCCNAFPWRIFVAVYHELPRTLVALRKRVDEVVANNLALEEKTILAATPLHKHHVAY